MELTSTVVLGFMLGVGVWALATFGIQAQIEAFKKAS
jgi:hypothetical protein